MPDKFYGDADFTVSASGGGSGQPVTFTAAGNCTVSVNTVHITGVGSCTITAHQAGDGNYDAATNVAQSFNITDNTPPETMILTGPSNLTASTSATFTFTGTDNLTPAASLTFECSLDGSAFASCTSPATYTSLAAGLHTFLVQARDAAGNVDASPASYSWTIDVTPPGTVLDSMPNDPSNQTTASFAFHATTSDGGSTPEAADTFQCGLDGGAFVVCASPTSYSGLADGPHIFAVRAVDAVGNVDNTPASFMWTVDTQAPDTLLDSTPNNITNSNNAVFVFHASDPVGGHFRL